MSSTFEDHARARTEREAEAEAKALRIFAGSAHIEADSMARSPLSALVQPHTEGAAVDTAAARDHDTPAHVAVTLPQDGATP